ncbi:MAG: hypothetical protein QM796_21620 [Chthoniobacteraceae bacterium]
MKTPGFSKGLPAGRVVLFGQSWTKFAQKSQAEDFTKKKAVLLEILSSSNAMLYKI